MARRSVSTVGSRVYTLGLVALVGMLVAVRAGAAAAARGRRRRHSRGGALGHGRRVGCSPCAACWWPARWRSRWCCWSAPACSSPASIACSPSTPASDAEGVLTGRISLPPARYADDAAVRIGVRPAPAGAARDPGRDRCGPDELAALQRRLQRQRDPGRGLPDGARRVGDLAVADRGQRGPASTPWACRSCAAGRSTRRDGAGAPRSIIVDERLAQRFWPDQDPDRPADVSSRATRRPARSPARRPVAHGGRRGRAACGCGRWPSGGNSGLFGAYYFPLAQSPDRGVAIVVRTTQSILSR